MQGRRRRRIAAMSCSSCCRQLVLTRYGLQLEPQQRTRLLASCMQKPTETSMEFGSRYERKENAQSESIQPTYLSIYQQKRTRTHQRNVSIDLLPFSQWISWVTEKVRFFNDSSFHASIPCCKCEMDRLKSREINRSPKYIPTMIYKFRRRVLALLAFACVVP